MKPFISVIIPCFNRAKLVIDALNSLLFQDYPKELFEVIMVDNSSTDSSVNDAINWAKTIAKDLNFSVVVEPKKGLVYTRHTGAKNAKGEILIFGDDDAFYDSNWISKISEIYQQFPALGAVGTKILVRWDKTPNSWIYKFEGLLGKLDITNGYIIRNKDLFINGGSFSIRNSVLIQTLGFNPGQLGDYIMGDSETGLCRKLHKLNIPIAYTSETTMWHIQFCGKHDTESDIKRRFANNGIADAYDDTFVKKIDTTKETERRLKIHYLKLLKSYLKFSASSIRYNKFYLAYLQYKLKYLNEYQNNVELKKSMAERKWLYDTNYIVTQPIYVQSAIA